MTKGKKSQAFISILFIFMIIILPVVVLAENKPVIFYTDIVSGPKSGGEGNNGAYLSIFGKGFGDSMGTAIVTVGGGEVVKYMVWSDSKVSVQLGSAVSSGDIIMTTPNGSTTAPEPFTVRSGNFYYISLTGSDSKGKANDINRPFRTPNYVKDLSAFRPGDFIIIRGGTYDIDDGTNNLQHSRWINAVKSGTAGYPLTVIGYPGETVTVQKDGTDLYVFRSHTSEDTSWWVVADLNVITTYCGTVLASEALAIGASSQSSCPNSISRGRFSYGRFVNIDISGGCRGYKVTVGLSDHVKLLGISIHDSGEGVDRAHPIYLDTEQNDTEVGWCKIERYAQSRALIQVHTDNFPGCYSYKSITNIKIHDNVIHDVTGQAILLDGGAGDVDIYNNIIYAAPYKLGAYPYDDVIALRGSGGHMNVKLYNNTIYVNPNHTKRGYILWFGSLGGTYCPERISLYNNIFHVTEGQDLYYSNESACNNYASYLISNNNIWYGSSSGLPSFAGANDRIIDPQFINPSVGEFHLKPTSPAIDKGAAPKELSKVVTKDFDGNVRPHGGGYDIGAYEYVGPQNTKQDGKNINAK